MKRAKLLFLFIVSIQLTAFAGGPWPVKKGKAYIKLSEWWTVFDQHYTDRGFLDPNVTTGIFNTNFYTEYGITDQFTVIANANLFSRTYMNNLKSGTTGEILVPGEALNSIGDIDLGFKYGFKLGKKIPVALSLVLGIPTGVQSGGSQGNLQTGDGEFNQIIQVDIGGSFSLGKIPAYYSAYTGINNRTQGFSDEWRLGAEAGLGLFDKKLWLISRLNIVDSFKNGATAETNSSTSIFSNNSEFSSIGLEANWYVSQKFGISAGAAGAFRGEIIAAAPSFNVGVFLDLK